MIYASSGAVGLSQEVLDSLKKYWKNNRNKKYMNVRQGIADATFKPKKSYIDRARETWPLLGNSAAGSAIVASLIAFPSGGEHYLLQYDPQSNPEEYTRELPFVAIGSGQNQADPFLAFIKEAVWDDRQPETVRQGIVGVLWALEHVITVNAGHGVGGKPSIGTLEKRNGAWTASMLERTRLDLYRGAINDAKKVLNEELNKPIGMSGLEDSRTAPPRLKRNGHS